MSNALVVNGSQTRSGHPIAVFGPQVSYFAPQILSILDIHTPDYAAMGASFPGTGLVELGRGKDYAWSATSASSDLIDMRVEKVCNPSGGEPQPNGTSYEFNGACVPMQREEFEETVLPKASGQGAPAQIKHIIHKTRHGIVQGWTTVNGKPVAIVLQRSTYNHDVDSVVGFLGFGDPNRTHDVNSWMDSAAKIDFTFNWFYADDRDTGYFVSGLDPVRNPAADPTLPTWGTGRTEWRGFLTRAQHPHEVNPPRGYFISWNNKPAPGFATDGEYAYSQTYRSVLLEQQLKRQLAAHPARPHPLRRGQGDGDRRQPGPRRGHPGRPVAEVRRQPGRTRRRQGDARPAARVGARVAPTAARPSRVTSSTPTMRRSRSPTSWCRT